MKATLIICAFLVVSSLAVGVQRYSVQKQLSGLRVKNSMSVLAEVRTLLRTGGPYTKAYELLDGLKESLIKEIATQTSVFNAQKKDCAAEISFRTAEIREAKAAKKAASEQRIGCDKAFKQATGMEKYFTTEISTKKAEKKEELFLRREQHAVFKHFEKEYITLQAQCKKAIAITRDLQSTVSTEKMNPYLLLQVSKEMTKSSIATQSFNKFVPVLLKMSALHKTVTVAKKGVNPQQKSAGTKTPVFLQAGAKAGAKSDAADPPAGTGYGVVGAEADPVQDLIGLITDLYNYATNELREIRKEEAIRVEQYVSLMKTLDFVIKDMEDELDEVREHKGEMRKCVTDEAKIELAAANKLSRNENIKGKTVKMCNSFNKEFAQANKAREEEMNLIQALYDLLEERLKGEMDHEDHDLEWKSKEKSGAAYKHDGLSEEKEKFIYEQESFKSMMDSPCSKGSDCNASNGMVCINRFTAKVIPGSETCANESSPENECFCVHNYAVDDLKKMIENQSGQENAEKPTAL